MAGRARDGYPKAHANGVPPLTVPGCSLSRGVWSTSAAVLAPGVPCKLATLPLAATVLLRRVVTSRCAPATRLALVFPSTFGRSSLLGYSEDTQRDLQCLPKVSSLDRERG